MLSCETLCCLSCLLQLTVLAIFCWLVRHYIRGRQIVAHILSKGRDLLSSKMELDDMIDELLETVPTTGVQEQPAKQPVIAGNQQHRDRLSAIAAGGQTKSYLGKALTSDQIESLDDDEVEKLYARYEAKLGAVMTKTLCFLHRLLPHSPL